MKNISVPFNNLNSQYLELKEEIDSAISEVIKTSSFVRGKYVKNFENDFANAIGIENCISCANGTDALYIAMKALKLKKGDQVIVPAHSWISTSSTVTQAGGEIVFCDTHPDNFTINEELIESLITNKTVGIIPVHLYGQAAEMDKILSIAKKYNLWIIEDCAQAHLAEYKGKIVGTLGDIGTFSFYPGKNLGAMGDAGAMVTRNSKLAENMTMISQHGGLKKGDHKIEGINSRLDGIQAAILSVKLPKLVEWTESRRKIAEKYSKELKKINDIVVPVEAKFNKHVWHLFVIKITDRNKLSKFLEKRNIQTGINYPTALPFLPAYATKNYSPSEFPCAFSNQSQILSLPIYPYMPSNQIEFVIECIQDFFNHK